MSVTRRKGLGKGLGALLGPPPTGEGAVISTPAPAGDLPTMTAGHSGPSLQTLPLSEIQRRMGGGKPRPNGGGAVKPDAGAGQDVDNLLDDMLDD